MERKIGNIFELNGKHYQVVKSDSDNHDKCINCDIKNDSCALTSVINITGGCYSNYRYDHNPVYFKLVDMCKNEKRTLEITIDKAKKWYQKGGELKEVALQVFNENELVDNRCHSWEEYVNTYQGKEGYGIDDYSVITRTKIDAYWCSGNSYPSREYAEAALALCKLLQLRQEWIGYWEPDWNCYNYKHTIYFVKNELIVDWNTYVSRPLSFPTEEMAEEFLHDFKDLLEQAKPLL